ncbi:MAG: response regulator [Owenweeksia sp.]
MSEASVGIVMIVDDNPTDRFVHKKLLEIHKIADSIIEFESGKLALQHLKSTEKASDFPDVILLDIMMPEMDGFDFMVHFSNLKDRFPKVPIVFMLSSTDDEKDIQRVRNNPLVKKMLRKPFSPDSFKKILNQNSDLR